MVLEDYATMPIADELLMGAYDMHAHGHPQFSLRAEPRLDDLDWARAAADAGMAGFVIKSHMWPTMGSTYIVNKLVEGVTAYASITLNDVCGGLNPVYVQIAAESGAKVVFMPTWSAQNDVAKGCHFYDRMRPYVSLVDRALDGRGGIGLLDAGGKLVPEVHEILDVCGEYNLVLASGHISIEESLLLAEAAALKRVKFVLTHPLLSPVVGATHEQMRAVADTGGYIEHCFIGCMPLHGGMNPRLIADAITAVGAEHTIMSTDAIEGWNPPAPEVLRMFISSMLSLGIPEEDVFTMTHTNPGRLLKKID